MPQPTLQDRVFGKLTWEDEDGWWVNFEFSPGNFVDVYIITEDPMDFLVVRQTYKTFEKIRTDESGVRQFAVAKLLKTYNEYWREENQPKLTATKFAESLKLFIINLFSDTSAAVYFDADWLDEADEFVIVSFDQNGEMVEAEIDEMYF